MKTTVLVADRDTNITRLLEEALKARGYRVLASNHGEEALQIAEDEQPDLVILGIMIPGMGGLNILKMIRSDRKLKGTKVIILTSLEDESTRRKTKRLGADDYFVKSRANLADLLSSVGGLVHG